MPGGGLLAAAGAGLTVAAILALKRRHAEQWFAAGGTLPPPAQKDPDAPSSSIPRTNAQGYAEYMMEQGNFVRGLDMNRRTSAGTISPHWGIDMAAPTGTPVYAVKGGTVHFAGVTGGYGNNVQISHGDGESTLYGHLNRILVRQGQAILPGWHIGDVGRTCHNPDGSSPAWCAAMQPHLHMEVHPYDTPRLGSTPRRLDPVQWLAQKNVNQARTRWSRT